MKNLPVSPLAPAAFPTLPPVAGMRASASRIGLYGGTRNDLMTVVFPSGASVAGAFTLSATRSADVEWCATQVKRGQARALVVNAGNSNAFTGPAGLAKNAATIAEACRLSGAVDHEVFLAATGVIGAPLPPKTVADALPNAFKALAAPDWESLARAFSTTDTFPKGAGTILELGGTAVNIVGLAKGSGMIAPNMATMLVFVFTDAAVAPDVLQAMVSAHVETTFNAITVDSDTSTSDTLLVFATGASGSAPIEDQSDPRAALLSEAFRGIFHDLAMQVVRDGEGAQKLIQIEVQGAVDDRSARQIGFAIANSPLVKTAIAGEDANWGRVVMAVGKAGEPIAVDRLAVRFGGQWTARAGGAVAYDATQVDAHMRGRVIDILVDVGLGSGQAKVWTCDLTHGYISINGDYRS
ncbi:bifunctional glutamate N-acetyltransferase/amino-acid acetyltransferase ArgJ [Aquidulcibacter sp.]|jgi:glutamate N-acetyltransferase/amino-acid N-acetyltransferase|uniref:bifunctional glutamate N-acetyltransferase/amino-acid acetyltransferase ArgJ n=1 Tax=Aquidulcibacter sp. TaxID=2052990 RepID=UPI0037BF1D71